MGKFCPGLHSQQMFSLMSVAFQLELLPVRQDSLVSSPPTEVGGGVVGGSQVTLGECVVKE